MGLGPATCPRWLPCRSPGHAAGQRGGQVLRDADQTVAIGRVAAAGDWACLTAIEVHPRYRRRGLGRAITIALAAAAAARGVSGLYLQVGYAQHRGQDAV